MASAPRMAPASPSTQILSEFCSDVVVGLSQPGQKELPSKYLYDEVGSALFDVICLLPEYGLSRAGMRMLERYSGEIVSRVPGPVVVAELGSGSGQKTRWVLEALARRQRVNYYPIDISGSALFRCQQELGQMDMVSIVGFERAYLDGLQEVAARRRRRGAVVRSFPRQHDRQFRPPCRRSIPARSALDPARGRCAAACDRSGKAGPEADAGVRRSGRRDGGVQQESAGADQPGTRRGFRFAAFRARGAMGRGRAPHRNAPALEPFGSASRSARRASGSICARAKRSGRKARTSTIRKR